MKAATHARVDDGRLRARDEHEAAHVGEVGELGGVELADRERVRLLARAREGRA